MSAADPVHTPFPKLAAPAQRALASAGYTHLEQLAEARVADLQKLHGIGPNALNQLRRALALHGWTFKDEQ